MMTRKAIVNIFSSYNNLLMTATDLTGAETIAKCSGGQVVKSSKDSGGQFAARDAPRGRRRGDSFRAIGGQQRGVNP